MVRYKTTDMQVSHVRISSRDDEVERMTSSVNWLVNVLKAERSQQLQQLNGMYIICMIDVHHIRPLNICTSASRSNTAISWSKNKADSA